MFRDLTCIQECHHFKTLYFYSVNADVIDWRCYFFIHLQGLSPESMLCAFLRKLFFFMKFSVYYQARCSGLLYLFNLSSLIIWYIIFLYHYEIKNTTADNCHPIYCKRYPNFKDFKMWKTCALESRKQIYIKTCINLFLLNKVIRNHSKFLFFFIYQHFSPSQENSRERVFKSIIY